jgi:hypothetical protein
MEGLAGSFDPGEISPRSLGIMRWGVRAAILLWLVGMLVSLL